MPRWPTLDLVLFASDVNRPLTTAELGFIQGRIVPLGREWLLVQTKADLSLSTERIVEENRKKLQASIPAPWCDVKFVTVSSLNKLDYLKSNDPRDLEESGFQELDREIWSVLNRTGVIRLVTRAHDDIQEIVKSMCNPLEAELSGLERDGSPQVIKLKRELNDADRRFDTVEAGHAQWRSELIRRLREMEWELLNRILPGHINNLVRQMKERISSDAVSIDVDAMARELEDDEKRSCFS